MAPDAKLFLVEAQSDSLTDLFNADVVASNLVANAGGGEVSNSWGSAEFAGETTLDTTFTTPGVVYFASSGDQPGVEYPAASPSVVATGGTTTSRDPATGNFSAEHPWDLSGSGLSAFESRPSYQDGIQSIVGRSRGVPAARRSTPIPLPVPGSSTRHPYKERELAGSSWEEPVWLPLPWRES